MPRIRVTGEFSFKITRDGDLLGQFQNNHTEDRWHVEAAQRANHPPDQGRAYPGTYHTAWFEEGPDPLTARLAIIDLENGTYRVEWHQPFDGRELLYLGEATIREDGRLAGRYELIRP